MTVKKIAPKKPVKRTGADRLGREDWTEAALAAMSAGGLAALSVERLAKELGATKGSFYWHFKDRSELIEAALDAWEVRDTDQVIERASRIEDPRERLQSMFRLVFSLTASQQVDTGLEADAGNPIVADAMARVAAKRLAYIDGIFQQMGSKAGSDRALLAYTAFIGLAQMRRTTPELAPVGRRSASYIANITKWLID